MSTNDLNHHYRQLRRELEAAYASWDVDRIDSVAARMLPLERALSSTQSTWAQHADRPLASNGLHVAGGVGSGPV